MVMRQGRRNNLSTTRDLSKPLLAIDGPDQATGALGRKTILFL